MKQKTLTRIAVPTIIACLALSGCGSNGADSTSDSSAASASGAAKDKESTGEDDSGTITVKTSRGDVEVPKNPKTIVALGETMAGMLETLDVEYAAVGGFYGDEKQFESCYPWLKDSAMKKLKPELVSQTKVNPEAVAALKPDVIFATAYLATDDKVYKQLSDIAPVVLPADKAANPDWDKVLGTVATAVGKPDDAAKIVKEVEDKFAAIEKEFPKIKGKTYQFFAATDDGYMMGNASPMKLIGMEPGKYHTDEDQNKTTFSWEKMGDLQADMIAVYDPSQKWWDKLQKDERFQKLPAVKSGNAYVTDLAAACAINNSDPIGLEWFLNNRVKDYAKKLHETSD